MGLDISVVKTEPLPRPAEPVYGFLWDLLLHPSAGGGYDADDDVLWGGSWANNGVYEFTRAGLRKRANNWANRHNLGASEKAKLRRWIRNLPWQDEYITLHLGN